MEKSTVIGLIGGIISVFVGMILKGAPLTALNNPAAFLIIIGGTIACIFNAFTMEQISKVPTLFKLLIQGNQEQSKGELVQTFVELSQLARREGILALESRV
ncbi:MAG: flagellar motor protein MotA, partial [Selenomonadaceae bacterium]|nr:flagellar motor protein MotA [Selenomonadaceae bacterium]